jgi:hypothetical protein
MSKARDILRSLTLLALVFTGPVAVAAYFLSSDEGGVPLILAAAGDGTMAAPGRGPDQAGGPSAVPVIAGVLYSKGTAQVDWSGAKTPVSDGSYAYLGGEMVSTGDGDMGLLQLDGGNSVYMCPGSRMNVTRADDGAYLIKLAEGTGRFVFAPGTDYRIEANRGVYSPAAGARSQPTVVEVAVYPDYPGGIVCGFSSRLDVAGYPADGGGAPIALGTAGPGEIIDLSRALTDEAATTGTPVIMKPILMPASVQSWLRENAPYPPKPGPIGYLCRCKELKRYAEADGIPDAAIAPLMLPPDGEAPLSALAADSPPGTLPSLVLAVPEAPNPADPGVLPTAVIPAPPLTVPAPLVPMTGFGGGVTSTPS